MNIITECYSKNFLVEYKGEQYRITVWEDGGKWIDWEIVFNDDHSKEVSFDLEEELMEELEKAAS
jgi:hypothetical protein